MTKNQKKLIIQSYLDGNNQIPKSELYILDDKKFIKEYVIPSFLEKIKKSFDYLTNAKNFDKNTKEIYYMKSFSDQYDKIFSKNKKVLISIFEMAKEEFDKSNNNQEFKEEIIWLWKSIKDKVLQEERIYESIKIMQKYAPDNFCLFGGSIINNFSAKLSRMSKDIDVILPFEQNLGKNKKLKERNLKISNMIKNENIFIKKGSESGFVQTIEYLYDSRFPLVNEDIRDNKEFINQRSIEIDIVATFNDKNYFEEKKMKYFEEDTLVFQMKKIEINFVEKLNILRKYGNKTLKIKEAYELRHFIDLISIYTENKNILDLVIGIDWQQYIKDTKSIKPKYEISNLLDPFDQLDFSVFDKKELILYWKDYKNVFLSEHPYKKKTWKLVLSDLKDMQKVFFDKKYH